MYLKEIAAMMHTFGDVKNPKERSVRLMETIVHDQMKYLLLEAEKIACLRQSPSITHKEVLFLMRTNKMKLKRLLDYLNVWDLEQAYKNDLSDEAVPCRDVKLRRKCLEFLASIEDCNEFTSFMKDKTVVDITTKRRKMRRFWMTYKMSSKEYGEFSKTSQASFCPLEKFKRWLLKDEVICFDLSDIAARIINFLARETIAEIVDMVLIMKMKKIGRYRPLYCDSIDYLAQSVSYYEMDDVLELANKDGDFEGYVSFSTSSNDLHSNTEISENEDNLNNFSHRICKEGDNASKNEDLNETHPKKSDPLLSSLSEKPQLDEHDLRRSRKLNLIHEVLYSSSKSKTKVSECNESVDKPKAQCNKVDLLNEPSNETESDPVPVDSSNQTYDLISDDDIAANPKSALANRNNDLNPKVVPPEVSDTEPLPGDDFEDSNNSTNSCLNSENAYQETDVAGASHQPQEKSLQRVSDISDTSDSEYSTQEVVPSPDPKKSLKRKSSPSRLSKKIAKDAAVVINSTLENHFMVAAQNEVNYITKPIERAEILEAVSLFQEPSRMAMMFAGDHMPKKTKLICLADSSLFNIT